MENQNYSKEVKSIINLFEIFNFSKPNYNIFQYLQVSKRDRNSDDSENTVVLNSNKQLSIIPKGNQFKGDSFKFIIPLADIFAFSI